MNSAPVLHLKGLHKSYFQAGQEISVLRDLSFTVQRGDLVAITGVSGAGKSTLLHCLGLLEEFEASELQLEGKSIDTRAQSDWVKLRREMIGFVFQFHYLMAELTALENVMLPLRIVGKDEQLARKNAADWLDRVGLSHRLDHRPSQLSGGEQQRVAIARALVRRPSLILADEPTGNLDRETGIKVFELLKQRASELSAALVLTTHNPELAAQMRKHYELKGGQLCAVSR